MTVYEIATLIAYLARSFGLAWGQVREIVIATHPHLEPFLDDAIADLDRARDAALARTQGDA